MSIRAVLLTLAVLINLPALAQQAELDDATVAERTEAISQTLRCVVCQNQSIADSNATLAEDMRRLVEARVRAGNSDDDVRAYMQERYGDFVLMSPPVKPETWLLWFGPLLFVGGGLIWFFTSARGARDDLDEDDEA
ncbi:cytochrome c-type biogenesis protein [Ponticaulis sp.]|uniref:cytochrome c-type biogenesis protein n=1 Tax=Ponticaulis sp. TaxID=2020902 RepID=UPI000B6771B6|nr:cytochrome c-type biogenesis protein [Ponticaulis sp.]MAI90065.1 cytochrome C biogenesis protein [Ponticaulis sp.]OUX99721.1 MAG: hypothetical protein CBB65_06460 [Hyphomonadaceae bacterium TMED5]